MSLDLDARQRAMLQEMGIHVWVPAAQTVPKTQDPAVPAAALGQPIAQPQAKAAMPGRQAAAAAPAATPAPGPRRATAPSAPVAAAAPASTAPALVLREPLAVYPQADPAATPAALGTGWLVVLESPTPATPFAGDAGKLLDNMLRAMRLHHHPRTFVAVLERTQPGQGMDTEPATALSHALTALQPAMVLVLGLSAARAMLGSREPLGRLRASAHQIAGPNGQALPAVVSYDPAYLLRAPDAKAAAWADLCGALAIVRNAAKPT